ncbi:MAG: porin family protein [Hymenobacter sp.]
MQIKHIALAAALLIATQARAQFGVKGGLSEAVLSGRVGEDASYKTYFHAGVFYQAHLIGPLSIQPELLYSLQGSQLKGATTAANYTTRLNYLAVPILVKATFGPLYVEAGPQFGLLVGASEQGTVQVSGASGQAGFGNVDRSSTDNYKRGDFALCGGRAQARPPRAGRRPLYRGP